MLIFVAVTSLMTTIVGLTFARVRLDDSGTYRAVFSDASGLQTGVDVRAVGVPVGTVKSVELNRGGGVLVTMTVSSKVPVTSATKARIRYANLTGDRFLDLREAVGRSGRRLAPGTTIPLSRTQPALDLDQFFAGFDPLMQALDPDEVNQLTSSIISVTEGQAGSVESLLGSVGSFTTHIAERDALIGDVITNLSSALGVVDNRRGDLDDLIVGLSDLLDGLAKDRKSIGASLASINTLAADTARVVGDNRADIKANVNQLGKVSRNVLQERDVVDRALGELPTVIQKLGRAGAYGSYFNFFLCGARVRIDTGDGSPVYLPGAESTADRCTYKAGER
ncbi:MCE family protein [Aeromicrobium sp.]|uniref:MCE family protein n=1 Tax=Aeromicrobium sp. TaxID=1871063 RepID=UPI0030BF3703